MFGEIFDASSNQSAVWAVVLGALLATAGGFAATQLERHFEHKRRERNAALFFGELLTTLQIILAFSKDTHGRGDPFGPITTRMLRSARKEIEIYDRNREALLDLRDADLRARIQTLVIRLTMPLEGIFEAGAEIVLYQTQIKATDREEMRRELEDRIAELKVSRDSGFHFVIETADQMTGIVRGLEPLAQHKFRDVQAFVANS
ncbi:MAG TPA: hypothetical protein VG309_07145 [Rhizomicrobium sp.]|nr:hypothetical protein [Rhizomicrobium sp.]